MLVVLSLRDSIFQELGMGCGTFPFRYLGVPLSPQKWAYSDCNLVEKIIARVKHWSARHLSYAGRLVLIQSV